jgi:hypothetical protein
VLRQTIGPGRDARRVNEQPLAPRVALLQIEAQGDDRPHGFIQREASPLGAPRIEERAQRGRRTRGGRLRSATDTR